MMWWYGGAPGWGWLTAAIGMALSVAVLIVLVVVIIRLAAGGSGRWAAPSQRPPEDLLRERFARGEIDEDEYRQRLAVLEEHGPR